MLEKRLFSKFSKIIKRTSLVALILKNFSSPINQPITIAKTDTNASVSLFVPRIFKIAVRAYLVESLLSKVTETSSFYNSVEKCNTGTVCSENKSECRNQHEAFRFS